MPYDLSAPVYKPGSSFLSADLRIHRSALHIARLLRDTGALDTFAVHRRIFTKGSDLIHENRQCQNAYLLTAGWACSYMLLRDGTRQIINFHVPGDLIGIRRLLIPDADDNLCAITSIEVREIDIEGLLAALRGNNCLAMSVLWSAFRDEAIVSQHLVGIGRRRPVNRAAHFFLELGSRLSLVGLGTKTGYQCPLTQSLIADALGLTAVHFNRVLRQLRELNAMTFHDGWVQYLDGEKLEHLADFDSSYLQ
ncbi:Crp/Fnr family transcriptional regulator [Rhizobium sp. SYY.PMSO]|uniref:Crp/Fnr family transcriptional regulator n=1 Tax=Rhizobium sp. SYY.PMSO TaxID=3382192 RepID=UPI00398F9D5F